MSADLTQSEGKDKIAAATEQSDPEPMEVCGENGDKTDTNAAPPAGSEDKPSTTEPTLVASHGDDVIPQGDDEITEPEDTEMVHMDEDSDSDTVSEHADDTRKADDKPSTGLLIGDAKNGRKLKSGSGKQDNGDDKVTEAKDTETVHMDDDSDSEDVSEHADDARKADAKQGTGLPIGAAKNGRKLMSGAGQKDNGDDKVTEPEDAATVRMDDDSDSDNVSEHADDTRKADDKPVTALPIGDAKNGRKLKSGDDQKDNGDDKETEAEDAEIAYMDDDSDSDNVREDVDDARKADDKPVTGLPISAAKNGRKLKSEAGKQYNGSPDSHKSKKRHKEKRDFPNTLEGFGIGFNDDGELRQIKSGDPFEFQVSKDHSYNQKRYEAIGELVTEHVYHLMETQAHLKRIWLPVNDRRKEWIDATVEEARSFFFASEDALTNEDKLLILIHGSGVVRAGQWARRLVINDNLDCGTQLPFIKKAVEDGFGVMVLNTNLNYATHDGKEVPIRENSTPIDHGLYVWDNFVAKAKAAHIAIVAHSYGGVVVTNLVKARTEEVLKRVFAVAFTDSVHCRPSQSACKRFYVKKARNWVSSDLPLDTELEGFGDDAPLVSSGDMKHEWTSWSSLQSIFKFFTQKYTERGEKTKCSVG